jgi:ubiquinone/menaquinone biosynthesis C-methylase UbiE
MMQAALQRRIQRYGWDKAASLYEESWREQLEPAQQRLLKAARLRPGERVLDIACGTGLVSFPAAAAVSPFGAVMGTDISEKMVAAARAEAVRLGLTHVSFERMDAERLELPDDDFDAALCSLGLMYVPDPAQGLRETLRVLRPGGRCVAAVWGERRRCGWAGIFPVVDARVRSEVCPLFFQLGTGDTLKRTFKEAGFGWVQSERLSTKLHYSSARDACNAAFAGGPVALAYSHFDEPTKREAHVEYLASIEVYRNGNHYEVPGEFVIVVGYKPRG